MAEPVEQERVCGCDEARAWKERALRSEARQRATQAWLRGLLGQVDETIELLGAAAGSEGSG